MKYEMFSILWGRTAVLTCWVNSCLVVRGFVDLKNVHSSEELNMYCSPLDTGERILAGAPNWVRVT